MITILVNKLGFSPGGKYLWVAAETGKVLLEIISDHSIEIGETRCENIVCHADVETSEEIKIYTKEIPGYGTLSKKSDSDVVIAAGAIEFSPHGNTIWVQSEMGATILRIKSKMSLKLEDSAIEDFEGDSERFYCKIHVKEKIDICLIESISRKYNLL